MSEQRGDARVFLDPPPVRGAHPGVRGYITADALGVHVSTKCEWLVVDPDDGEWPMGEWSMDGPPTLIPWHRVHSIEWGMVARDDS